MKSKNILLNLKKKKLKKIIVIGEIFEDIFAEVKITKISPEAPVMVISPKNNIKTYLGGAGNVLQNLLSAKLNVRLISLAEDNKLKFINKNSRNKIDFLFDKKYKNIKKIRYVSNNKHIIRIDHEKTYNFPLKKNKEIIQLLKKNLKNSDTIIFSDYNKGFLTNFNIPESLSLINKNKNIKIFVDSKRSNLEIFKNVYLIKINNLEACDYFKIKNVYDTLNYKKIYDFLKHNNINYLIITTGKDGAILFYKNKFKYIFNKKKKDVFDVSGAGDTFLSYLVYANMNGLDIKKSIQIANQASFLAISKYGISSIKISDL